MPRSRRAALWERIAAGQLRNIDFEEFCRLVEAFGFELRRVSGSHHIYRHSRVPRLLNLQSRNGEAKPYQIAQFLELVTEFDLKLDTRR